MSWFRIVNKDDGPAEILIYDQIGKDWFEDSGVNAKDFAAALKDIPAGREITLRINSPGGNVHDGLAIYNQLSSRRTKLNVIVDGVAASIASVIALAGRSLSMPRNALLMIHDPSGVVMGTSADMRKMADVLDTHRDSIASIYEDRTGIPRAQLHRMMSDETWMDGADAVERGFATDLMDEVRIAASFDLSCFRRVPEALRNHNSAGLGGAKQRRNEDMNRKAILALLRKHGVKVEDNATDEQLLSAIGKLEENKETAKDIRDQLEVARGALTTTTPPAPTAQASTPTPQAQAPAQSISIEQFRAMENRMNTVTAQLEAERKQRIERAIDNAIAECRITAQARQDSIDRALKDESFLTFVNSLPQHQPGAQPASIEFVGTSVKDITDHFRNLAKPMQSWLKGAGASRKDVYNAAVLRANHYWKHRDQLMPIMNTNTIDSDLQRQTILQEMMRAFATRILPLRAFSTVFESVPLEGTDEVVVPYFDLQTAASTDWNAGNGYVMGDTSSGKKKVTINKRKYQAMTWSSDEGRRQPYFNALQLGMMNAEKLAVDVFTDILSLVTSSNYSTAAVIKPAAAFYPDDVVDLRKVANEANWPTMGRSLFLDSAYDANLLKQEAIRSALAFGGAEAIREGRIPNLYGFGYYQNPNIPDNSENLTGFINHVSAMIVATAPIQPNDDVRNQLTRYELMVDPGTGISMEYRQWGDADYDTSKKVVECNYGYALGNAAALKRIVSS